MPGSGEDNPPPPTPQEVAELDVSEHSAEDADNAVATADLKLIVGVSAALGGLFVFIIMIGAHSVLRRGQKAGGEGGGVSGSSSPASSVRGVVLEAALEAGGAQAARNSHALSSAPSDRLGAVSAGSSTPSGRLGAGSHGGVQAASSAPRPPMGRASAGLSACTQLNAAGMKEAANAVGRNETALLSPTGLAALARAQGAQLKRGDPRAGLRDEAGLQRRSSPAGNSPPGGRCVAARHTSHGR